jgi:hypothetical protein
LTCRVTGGGTLIPGTSDTSCITVNTTIFPLTVNGVSIKKITHGGQLGAPFNVQDCGSLLASQCIRGQWQHNRHYVGKGNPRDEFDVDFHSATPKGFFDSLICGCLGCCDPKTGAFITPLTRLGLCNPDDHKICGPQPRPAPANSIIFSGLGTVAPADDSGVNGKKAEWVVFRVYIEDRSEPGGFHPKGAVEPADVYVFQAWRTGILVTKKPDACHLGTGAVGSSLAGLDINAFRACLAQSNCDFVNSLQSFDPTTGAGKPPGTLPSPTTCGATADVQDFGPLHDGNQQIHPSTGAVCTLPATSYCK